MSWKRPPILDGPHRDRMVDGRRLMVYYDGRRARLVAWKTKRGVYYVHNTLARTVRTSRLVAIAASLRRIGQ